MPKATDVMAEQRTMEIYHLLLTGNRRAEILQYASEKDWGLTSRQIDTYIGRASAQFKKQSNFKRERERGKAMERLNYLFMKALKVADYRTALAVQKDLSALLGLNAPTKIEVTWQDQAIADIRAGKIPYKALADAFDESLAAELFRKAGVPIPTGQSAGTSAGDADGG